MKKLVETVLDNRSTKDVFLFRVACDTCGEEYGNVPMRFSRAGFTPVTQREQTLCAALYEQEARTAKQCAVRVAAEQMNYCPVCKRLVCNQCFLICEDLDMCKRCAADLEQHGKSVLSDVVVCAE